MWVQTIKGMHSDVVSVGFLQAFPKATVLRRYLRYNPQPPHDRNDTLVIGCHLFVIGPWYPLASSRHWGSPVVGPFGDVDDKMTAVSLPALSLSPLLFFHSFQ